MPTIIDVKIRSSDRNLKEKSLIYEAVTADRDDPIIKDLIEKAIKNFGGHKDEIEKVTVTIKLDDL